MDQNAKTSLKKAWDAGFKHVDLYFFPCAHSKSASSQVDDFIKELGGEKFGMVWVDVENNPSTGCNWISDHAKNCQFLNEIIDGLQKAGKHVGIYASHRSWVNIFGSEGACIEVSQKVPGLWYPHYDGKESFLDFVPYGGWKKP